MLNLLAAGLATATSILTCFIDIYPNNPRSIDQETIFLTCFQTIKPPHAEKESDTLEFLPKVTTLYLRSY